MKYLLYLAFAGAMLHAQVTITDTVVTPMGGNWAGTVVVTLNNPATAQPLYSGSTTLSGWSQTVTVTDGAFSMTLYANDAITPAGTSYTARFTPTSGSAWSETWVVPTGATTIRELRSTTVPTPRTMFTPSQITQAGAALNNVLRWNGSAWAPYASILTDPMTTTGDIIYRTGGVPARLGIGSTGQVLTVTGGAPGWATNLAGNAATATLAATATALATPRTIAGVSFDGSGNISIPSTGLSDSAGLVRGAAGLETAGWLPFVSSAGTLGQGPIFFDTASGNVAIGLSSGLNEAFEVRKSVSAATGNTYGIRSTFTLDQATNAYQWAAGLNEIIVPSSSSANFTGLIRAGYNYVRHDGSGVVAEAASSYPIIRANNSAVITTAYSFYDSVQISNTASIGTLHHLRVNPAVNAGSGTIGAEVGLYVGNITTPIEANRFAIFTAGVTNKVHFSGPTDIDSSLTTNGSAQILSDGSAAAPGFATASNSNMGMYRAANNILGFAVFGVERMRLSSVGATVVGGIRPVGDVVSNLPAAASNTGMLATVTDANATTIGTTVVGGGANTVLVWSNGTNWRIYAN